MPLSRLLLHAAGIANAYSMFKDFSSGNYLLGSLSLLWVLLLARFSR